MSTYDRIKDLEKRLDALERAAAQKQRDIIIGLPTALMLDGKAPRLILVAPNGTQYSVVVDNAGVLSTTAV